MLERARLRICHDNNREEPGLLSNLAEALALCEGVGREIRNQWKRSDLEAADSELRLSTSLSKLHSAAATVEERLEELRAACAASEARSCVVSSLRDAQHQEDLEARERALLEAKATLSHERHQHAVSMQGGARAAVHRVSACAQRSTGLYRRVPAGREWADHEHAAGPAGGERGDL